MFRVQLLKVLETRKTVLQKEQGMAFARAVAAGFDVDLLTPLMSFAESFGATRLMSVDILTFTYLLLNCSRMSTFPGINVRSKCMIKCLFTTGMHVQGLLSYGRGSMRMVSGLK